LALRADFVDDRDGVLGPPPSFNPLAAISGPGAADGYLGSVTLTLNYKPVPSLKIQPEVRYDYTSYPGGLDGKKSQMIVGCGISYLF
jgi:hypothetical protein